MNDARDGKGIDRHLFGLWCAAYEEDIDIPELYDDPLYKKRWDWDCSVKCNSSENNNFISVAEVEILCYQLAHWDTQLIMASLGQC